MGYTSYSLQKTRNSDERDRRMTDRHTESNRRHNTPHEVQNCCSSSVKKEITQLRHNMAKLSNGVIMIINDMKRVIEGFQT